MIVSAILRNARISSQKVKPILDKIRGMQIEKAITMLSFSNKKAAFITKKLLTSVLANAEHNKGLDIDNMFINTIYTVQGPSFKRFKTRAKGRSDKITKRNSHIFVNIKERE